MRCFTIRCPTAITASPTSQGEPQIVMAHEADMRRDGDLCVGKVMDLVQTCTSMANDMAGNSVWNGKGRSDAGLIHRGNGVDCLLGAMCRRRCSAGVPATM